MVCKMHSIATDGRDRFNEINDNKLCLYDALCMHIHSTRLDENGRGRTTKPNQISKKHQTNATYTRTLSDADET